MASDQDFYGRQAVDVRKIFGDLDIVEAKSDFVVYVSAAEHQTGVRGDANKCMFSEACKRAFGSKGVLFYPTVAYVDMIDPDDPTRRIVMRFVLPTKTRLALEAFDLSKDETLERTFILKAVPKTRTLAYMKKYAVKNRKQQDRVPVAPAVLAARQAAAQKGQETKRRSRLMGIRQGAGHIHTT